MSALNLNYCLNGCMRRHGDSSLRSTTEGKSQLCVRCEDRLHDWLKKIPDNYALVPLFIEHGSTDANPEGTVTKRADAQAPMRLDPIDILDTRRGRMWLCSDIVHHLMPNMSYACYENVLSVAGHWDPDHTKVTCPNCLAQGWDNIRDRMRRQMGQCVTCGTRMAKDVCPEGCP